MNRPPIVSLVRGWLMKCYGNYRPPGMGFGRTIDCTGSWKPRKKPGRRLAIILAASPVWSDDSCRANSDSLMLHRRKMS